VARRLFVMASALAFVGLGLLSGTRPATVLAADAYQGPCSTISANYKAIVARGAGIGSGNPGYIAGATDIYGVIGDARVSTLGGCTGGVGPEIDAVLPANLQNGTFIVQFGWAICFGSSTLKCGASTTGLPSDSSLHFVYTCHDNDQKPCIADSWTGGPPSVGTRYRFRIEKSGSSWLFTLTNNTTGTVHTHTIGRSTGFSTGNLTWYGAENYDSGSILGSKSASTDKIHMYWMQYHRTSVSGWQVAEPVTTLGIIQSNQTSTWPSWWLVDDYSQNYTNDAQDIWTILHPIQ
jgi:hypothetical protein